MQARHVPSLEAMLGSITESHGHAAVTSGEMRRYRGGESIAIPPLPEGTHYGEDHFMVVMEGAVEVHAPAPARGKGLEMRSKSPWYLQPGVTENRANARLVPWYREDTMGGHGGGSGGGVYTMHRGCSFGYRSLEGWACAPNQVRLLAAKPSTSVFFIPCKAFQRAADMQEAELHI